MTNPCGQSVFSGCAGDQCDRDCFGKVVINIDAQTATQNLEFSRLTWVAVGLALATIFCFAGLYGASVAMDRVNQAYAMERV